MASPWPSTPFRLISSTGVNTRRDVPPEHYCRRNAQIMALTHNTMFRALNAIYHQAPLVQPSTQEASDLLFYCTVVHDFIHEHHTTEETVYFPAIEAASGIVGLMSNNLEQHRQLEKGLDAFRKYADETAASAYSSDVLRQLIDDLAAPLETHLHEEIPTILDLHQKIDSKTMQKIYGKMHNEAERISDKFKYIYPPFSIHRPCYLSAPWRTDPLLRCTNRAGPFVLGSQDKSFLLDDTYINFPEVPFIVPYLVDWILSRRHQGAWRFNCSDMYGNPRPFPNRFDATSRTYLASKGQGPMARVWSSGLIFFVLLLLCVFAAVKLSGLTSV
jgi:hemerythrin-like domain-containing protein